MLAEDMNKSYLLILMLLLTACSSNVREHVISDITKSELITLRINDEKKYPHSFDVHGIGDITGEAKITLMLNGKPYKTEKINGKVDFHWDGDWYEQKAVIKYEAKNVTKGKLKLRYHFVAN